MPGIQRQGDPNAAGGVIQGGVGSVRVNGRPIAVRGLAVTPHTCCGRRGCGAHCSAVTQGGIGSVRAAGIPVIVNGSSDSCGHSRNSGSGDVRAA